MKKRSYKRKQRKAGNARRATQTPPGINRKHKDSVFRLLFGSDQYKAYALELYNAINKTAYGLEDLEINSLSDAVYMGVKNDASLVVGSEMSLWEHQSSFNPNMPLRGLIYFGSLYDAWVTRSKQNQYSRKRLQIPTPRYYVFYNGEESMPERSILRLSDLYQGEGDIEITATMLDINEGRNKELMDHCRPLRDYARLIARIREYNRELPIDEAIDKAVVQCIQEGVLADFLETHRAEVNGMMLTEYNEKKTMELFKKEWYEDGWADGQAKGWADGQADSLAVLARNLPLLFPGITAEEARKKAAELLQKQ